MLVLQVSRAEPLLALVPMIELESLVQKRSLSNFGSESKVLLETRLPTLQAPSNRPGQDDWLSKC